jgi:hypothetical protein
VHTSVVIPSIRAYSGGTACSIWSETTITLSSSSARWAIGVLISVGRNSLSSENEVPCAPTARTRRRPASAMKIAARRIVVSRQIASQIRS